MHVLQHGFGGSQQGFGGGQQGWQHLGGSQQGLGGGQQGSQHGLGGLQQGLQHGLGGLQHFTGLHTLQQHDGLQGLQILQELFPQVISKVIKI